MTNVRAPERYDERIFNLALGVEPIDAHTGLRIGTKVAVWTEHLAMPPVLRRIWRPAAELVRGLRPLRAHDSGRFSAIYERREPLGTVVRLRITDRSNTGRGERDAKRRIVPRRAQVAIADIDTVAPDGIPTDPPRAIWRRSFPLACFPGAAAPIPRGATVLRGTLGRTDPDPSATGLQPVRWARVRATDTNGIDVGWAHADDRGEFVLVVSSPVGAVTPPNDPMQIRLTVGFVDPSPASAPPRERDSSDPSDLTSNDPISPRSALVDELWDLPVEVLTLSADPALEPSLTGRRFLPEHSLVTPLDPPQPIALPLGRETSHVIQLA